MILTTWSGGPWDRRALGLARRQQHPGLGVLLQCVGQNAGGVLTHAGLCLLFSPAFRLKKIITYLKTFFFESEMHFTPGIVMRELGIRAGKKAPPLI